MKPVLLTVTIPTWNREKLLKELLDILIAQIHEDGLEDYIEVLVSNNGSTDATEQLVHEFKSKYGYITYINNGINKGARYNVLNCMALASGKYLILFGDDDRPSKGSLKRIIGFLKEHPDAGSLFDSHIFKRNPFGNAVLSLNQLLDNFYYYLGNAGLFILKTDGVKDVFLNHPYETLSPTWPQTQVMILAAERNRNEKIYIQDLNILAPGQHEMVMIYTSYYLWRTTYYDFIIAIEDIKNEITADTLASAKKYFKRNINQLFFNILQCGVFLDDRKLRYKTAFEIFSIKYDISIKEKFFLYLAGLVLCLPVFISRAASNAFIFISRGSKGMKKKNEFVSKEKLKRELKEKKF